MKFKGELKTEFDDFARAISDVLETDVIITDADMNVIGSAFQYFSLYQDIKIGSLIAEVFYDNRDVLLEHKREKESCRQCPEYHNCKMESFVGVPIRRDLRTVGVIALILPKDRGKALFKKIGSTVTFMHSMAELIASKIMDSQYSRIIEAKNDELKGILDAHDAALAYTDFYGSILFVNEAFRKLFRITEPVLGTRIQELFPYKAFQETFQKADRKPRMVKATMEQSQFFGIINIKPIYEHRHGTSMLFTFRRYSEIQKESVQFTNGSYITFDFLGDICDTELIYRGRDYARENKNIILVNTDDGEINELLAKAIHNESSRKLKDILIMHSSSIYRDYLCEYLFGEDGLLKNIHDGTIIIHYPERMQIYYQERLAEVIEGRKKQRESEPVRIIFCTDQNLEERCQAGLFSWGLYDAMKDQTLRTGRTIHTDSALFCRYAENMIDYYCRIYKKTKMELNITAADYKQLMKLEINELNIQLEMAVRNNGYVAAKTELQGMSSREYELKTIRELLDAGKTQREICARLSISRSTLNRRIAELRK
ncbi:winged helix-turn-helix transcriptional regulator [Clostridium sp. OF09-36]|jgi:transcriptional regulator with PAS, ATPase and Fis domain|uniref:sigma 54-interacting transcriptional regulator n=1 Tax=Clostridium sp. OF09-36 TaxID=2292310 RepID=UPI000E5269CF|nr:sigma 54-interacting transcriptional regulator [Clostridium sp. OF09-36]RHV86035.1 winged helix-turn-helix transcriptional regulator [Clostridium sp. OF09-36]